MKELNRTEQNRTDSSQECGASLLLVCIPETAVSSPSIVPLLRLKSNRVESPPKSVSHAASDDDNNDNNDDDDDDDDAIPTIRN